jgi:hypothetical protein
MELYLGMFPLCGAWTQGQPASSGPGDLLCEGPKCWRVRRREMRSDSAVEASAGCNTNITHLLLMEDQVRDLHMAAQLLGGGGHAVTFKIPPAILASTL